MLTVVLPIFFAVSAVAHGKVDGPAVITHAPHVRTGSALRSRAAPLGHLDDSQITYLTLSGKVKGYDNMVYLHLWLKAIRMPDHMLIRGFCVDEDLEHFQEGYGGLIRAGFNRDDMKLRLRTMDQQHTFEFNRTGTVFWGSTDDLALSVPLSLWHAGMAFEVHYGDWPRWTYWTPSPVTPYHEHDKKQTYVIALPPLFGHPPEVAMHLITQFVSYHVEVQGFSQVILFEHGRYLRHMLADKHVMQLINAHHLQLVLFNRVQMYTPIRPYIDQQITYNFAILAFAEAIDVRLFLLDNDEVVATSHGKRFVDLFEHGGCLRDEGMIELAQMSTFCHDCKGSDEMHVWDTYDYRQTLPHYTKVPREHFWDARVAIVNHTALQNLTEKVRVERDWKTMVDPTAAKMVFVGGIGLSDRGSQAVDLNCATLRHFEHRHGRAVRDTGRYTNMTFTEAHLDFLEWQGEGEQTLADWPTDDAWLWWAEPAPTI